MDTLFLLLIGMGAGVFLILRMKSSIVNGQCSGCPQSGDKNCSCRQADRE